MLRHESFHYLEPLEKSNLSVWALFSVCVTGTSFKSLCPPCSQFLSFFFNVSYFFPRPNFVLTASTAEISLVLFIGFLDI